MGTEKTEMPVCLLTSTVSLPSLRVVEMVKVSVSVSPANENTHEVRVLIGQSIEEQLTKLFVRTNVPARINKMVVITKEVALIINLFFQKMFHLNNQKIYIVMLIKYQMKAMYIYLLEKG